MWKLKRRAVSFTWCLWRRQDEICAEIVFYRLVKKEKRGKAIIEAIRSLQVAREALFAPMLRKENIKWTLTRTNFFRLRCPRCIGY